MNPVDMYPEAVKAVFGGVKPASLVALEGLLKKQRKDAEEGICPSCGATYDRNVTLGQGILEELHTCGECLETFNQHTGARRE
jgi:protein-arginine kinase activator protein McsA